MSILQEPVIRRDSMRHTVISKFCPYFESLHSTPWKILLSLFLRNVIIFDLRPYFVFFCTSYTKLRVIGRALFFVLPSKL